MDILGYKKEAGVLDRVPNMGELAQYNVTLPGYEAITQTLYDYQALAASGVTQLQFFSTPTGQGGKTLSDTNMTLAGQLPANQQFLVTGIEIVFFPTTPAVAADNPAAYGAKAVANLVNDVYTFTRSGNITFTIGSKVYVQEAPMGKLPPKTHMAVDAALTDSTTLATDSQSRIAFAYAAGRPYNLRAPLRITENMSFGVTLNWPEGARTYANAARVGVILDGVLYRLAQ